jgi:osmoprotectant transport system permease protein
VDILLETITYFASDQVRFWRLTGQHLTLSFSALLISIAVCVPLGIAIARHTTIAQIVMNLFNGLRVLPSLVILFLALPYLGLGFWPSLIALVVLAFPPILINTYAGMRSVSPAVVEAARGMGMSDQQVLTRIELPLALPAILAGIRTAAVEVIASATLAAFIAGGGLGEYITRGFALNETDIMLVGAIAVAVLALGTEAIFGGLQRLVRQPI